MSPRDTRNVQEERRPQCAVCHDETFSFRCPQCHKPVGDNCAFKTAQGAFCGRECALNYRDFKENYEPPPKKGWPLLVKVMVAVVVLAAIAIVADRMGWFSIPLLR